MALCNWTSHPHYTEYMYSEVQLRRDVATQAYPTAPGHLSHSLGTSSSLEQLWKTAHTDPPVKGKHQQQCYILHHHNIEYNSGCNIHYLIGIYMCVGYNEDWLDEVLESCEAEGKLTGKTLQFRKKLRWLKGIWLGEGGRRRGQGKRKEGKQRGGY